MSSQADNCCTQTPPGAVIQPLEALASLRQLANHPIGVLGE
jgi:hypothetical protein